MAQKKERGREGMKEIAQRLRRAWYLQDSSIRFDSTLYLSESGVPTHSRTS
jgi:ribose 1,5-bisphosphokinase PhnN